MPKYVVAFSVDPAERGKTVTLTEDEAKVQVREGRLRLAEPDKPQADVKRAGQGDGAKATV